MWFIWAFLSALTLILLWSDGVFHDGWALFRWITRKLVAAWRGQPAPEIDTEALYQQVMEIPVEGLPEGQIEAWTPQEREVFGINDTVRLIDSIEKQITPQRTLDFGPYGGLVETVTEVQAWQSAEPVRRVRTPNPGYM